MAGEGLEIFGLNLPFYIVITIFFSYIIWSKFLNQEKDKLRPKSIMDIMDIILIGFFIFILIFSFLYLILIIGSMANIYFDFDRIWSIITFLIPWIVFLGILAIISEYRNREGTSRNFKELFLSSFDAAIIFIMLASSILILVLSTYLRYILSDFIVRIIFVIILLWASLRLVNKTLFRLNLVREFKKRKYLKIGPLFLLIITLVGIASMPLISYKEPINLGYKIFDKYGPHEAFLEISVPVDIITFGYIGSLFSLIPLRYGYYNIETEDLSGKEFKILINKSSEPYLQTVVDSFENVKNYNSQKNKKFGFTNIILNEDSKIVSLKFTKEEIEKEDVNAIILQGYVPKNISELNYEIKIDDYCDMYVCNIKFNLTNGLTFPVWDDGKTLINLNNRPIINKTICKFTNLTISENSLVNTYLPRYNCEGDRCEITLRNNETHYREAMIYLFFDNQIIRLDHIEINQPLRLNAEVTIEC